MRAIFSAILLTLALAAGSGAARAQTLDIDLWRRTGRRAKHAPLVR
jgi:hypothetical protein